MIHKITMPTPFAVGDVNAFLLKGDALTLIDAGLKTPEAYEALKWGLKEAGYTFRDIDQVVLTHHHPDHAGWIEAFDRANILGHAYNDPWLRRDDEFFAFHDAFYLACLKEAGVPEHHYSWVDRKGRSVQLMGERPLDQFLSEGDALPGHEGWGVIETPGHAQSHLVFWHETSGTMIGGDLLLAKVSSNPLIEPPFDQSSGRPRSLLQYNHSIKRLLDLPITLIYTGHGDEVRNAHVLIKERLELQETRAMKVLGMMEEKPQTIFQLTRQIFPAVYEKQLGLTLSQTVGQVDFLLHKGLIEERRDEKGVLWYAQT
ncbi:MBL fold metallo-hydrolase [Sporosarcina sp. HYO08]|uniref:MBL fold metallo-hydrolase n=1 Tax=Sporosarcina sp. HYO08 TaxID=1759557 RepID=UPI00079A6204|nr:MBL fold metallo-hydrolase [Sporosarcina sp. HYO08]KXH81690.1 MBL fold metallo-hydrolase [Sporosarcina sp. HYO08]